MDAERVVAGLDFPPAWRSVTTTISTWPKSGVNLLRPLLPLLGAVGGLGGLAVLRKLARRRR